MKSKVTLEEKVKQVLEYITGNMTLNEAASKIGVAGPTLSVWTEQYYKYGLNSLFPKISEAMISDTDKQEAVKKYIEGTSLFQVAYDYHVGTNVLKKWIKQYNASINDGGTEMSKGTISIEMKIKIAKYCLEHDINYGATAAKFKQSYQNVYSWTKKYAANGEDGLKDLRGKNKKATRLKKLDADKDLEAQLAAKDREIHLLHMENDYLKKLAELSNKINVGKKTKK